jgi:glycosyltransferase involved in cell wall biosynthesis
VSGRILHLHNYSNWGGNLVHVRLVLAGLAPDPAFELLLAAPERETYRERFRGLGIRILSWEARSRSDARAVLRLARLIRAEGIDIVHSHLRRTDWICAWARLLCPGASYVTTVHGEVNRGGGFRRAGGLRSAAYGLVLARRFDRVLAVSEDLARQLEQEENGPRRRLAVLTNGVPIAPLPSTAERRAARHALGLLGDRPALVMAGRFGARKGHAVLLEAAAREAGAGRPWEILLLGDGDLEADCRALAARLGIAATTHFCGFRTELEPYWRAAEVVAVPSYSEGLPRALLEGMAAGLAPVASDIGGVREALDAPRWGLAFPAGDAAALAALLRELWTSPTLRHELGERARARVAERYPSERLVEEHRRLYAELLAGRPHAARAAA